MAQPSINAEKLLKQTNYGFTIFQFIVEQNGQFLHQRNGRCKNILNQFYNDGKGSLSIYYNRDSKKWHYKDHGNTDFYGDCFDFAGKYYKLDPKTKFPELLEKISKDLEGYNPKTSFKLDYERLCKPARKLHYQLNEVDFTVDAIRFWEQYGVTEGQLLDSNIVQIKSYEAESNSGEIYQRNVKDKQLYFAYKEADFAKLYSPFPKEFRYVGNKKKDYMFCNSIVEDFGDGANIIITGGEKDALALGSIGIPAICLESETAKPSSKLLKSLFKQGYNPTVMLDCDSTGKKMMKTLQEEFNLDVFDLGSIVSKELKDQVCDVAGQILHESVK